MTRLTVYGRDETGYHLPDYTRLLPWQDHPQRVRLARESRAWVARFPESHTWAADYRRKPPAEALAEWMDDGFDRFSCLSVPQADTARMRIICDLNQWYGMLDDIAAAGGRFRDTTETMRRAAFERTMSILYTQGEPHGGTSTQPTDTDRMCLGRLLADSWHRWCVTCPPALLDRCRAGISQVLQSWITETEIRIRGQILDFPTYLAFRRTAVAASSLPRFVEYGLNIDIGSELAAHPELKQLEELQCTYLVLLNDLYSFRKEYVRSKDPVNAIAVLTSTGHTLQQAVNYLCQLMQETEREFVTLRKSYLHTRPGLRSEVPAFLTGLGLLMSGTLQYHRMSPRYHGTGRPWTDIGSGYVTLDSNTTVITRATP
ncbi:terpene synthase family protein [Streptomyces sp. NPDC059003]|uniref:terpene synthase family protein n=1 Tax=Streptomyces sp. NPDC059003 TaxID=3346691 RepID=UPI003697AB0A